MRKILLLLTLLAHIAPAWSHDSDKDKEKDKGKEPIKGQPAINIEVNADKAAAPSNMVLSKSMQTQLNKSIAALQSQLNAAEANMAKYDDMADIALPLADNMAQFKAKGEKLMGFLDTNPDKMRDISNFTFESFISLPIGFTVGNDNNKITLGILEATIQPNYVTATLFVKADVNTFGRKQSLFFGVEGLSFTQKGFVSNAPFTLKLLGDHILTRPDAKYSLILRGSTDFLVAPTGVDLSLAQTWIKFGCDPNNNNKTKFLAANIKAEVIFPRTTLLPYDTNLGTAKEGTERVKFDLNNLIIDSPGKMSNWLLTVSVGASTPFCVPDLKRYGFSLMMASYDQSDTQNPPALANFPTAYVGETSNLWRGFHLQTLILYLPKAFKSQTDDQIDTGGNGLANNTSTSTSTTLEIHDMIIDNTGFTGKINYSQGTKELSANKWSYNIEKLNLNFVQNKFIDGGFEGLISTPFTDGADQQAGRIRYIGSILGDEEYRISAIVESTVNYKMRVFRAKGTFDSGTWVKLFYDRTNNRFYPSCNLNGTLDMGVSLRNEKADSKALNSTESENTESTNPDLEDAENSTVKFKKITFSNILVNTYPSFSMSVGSFVYEKNSDPDNNTVGRFPVIINSINSTRNFDGTNRNLNLTFDLGISLAKDKIKGRTVFTLKTVYDDSKGKFIYKGARIEEIAVTAAVSAFKLDGNIKTYHCTQGKGFMGKINVTLNKPFPKPINICTTANFGFRNANDGSGGYRYGYVDAFAGLGALQNENPGTAGAIPTPGGIPTGLGDLTLKGIGFGLYFNMKPVFANYVDPNNPDPIDTDPNSRVAAQPNIDDCTVQTAVCSPSKLFKYIPNKNIAFGVKVMVAISNLNQSFDAFGSVELAFNKNLGIDRLAIAGQGSFASKEVTVNTSGIENTLRKRGLQSLPDLPDIIDSPIEQYLLGDLVSEYNTIKSEIDQEKVLEIAKKQNNNDRPGITVESTDKYGTVAFDFGAMIADQQFHAELEVWVNKGGLRGAGKDGSVGRAVLHIGGGEYYLNVGTPSKPIALILGNDVIKLKAYLMVGNRLEPFPGPPASVASFFQLSASNSQVNNNTSQIINGTGIGLGANLAIQIEENLTDKIKIVANAEAGLDFMLGKDINCQNAYSKDWLFRGRLYAYANFAAYRNSDKFLGLGLGFYLEGNGPKPLGGQGTVCIEVALLGWIDVKACANVKVGTICN
jgi:hypothetical protein